MPVHNVDTNDTDASIEYGAEYLSDLKDQFGSWELALAAYNWGPGNLSKKGIEKAPRETRDYIKKIMSRIKPAVVVEEEEQSEPVVSNKLSNKKASSIAKKPGLDDSSPKLDSVSETSARISENPGNATTGGNLANKEAVLIAQKVPLRPQ